MDIKEDLLQQFINSLIKRLIVALCQTKNQQRNYTSQLLENSKKPVKVYSSFEDNIWGADLADSKYVIVDGKYAWFVSLKDKKVTIITDAFQKILDESKQMGR